MAFSSKSSAARTFVITGATDGIGRHTAQKLAADGHGLVIHGRRPDVGTEVADDLRDRGAAFCHYVNGDLADLDQVNTLADEIGSVVDKIDVLVNNAGVFDPTPRISKQGYDMTWAVNVMAPFLLTRRLLPLLVRGSEPRIITTSSISQSWSLPSLYDLFANNESLESMSYSAHRAYSHSKLGDLMFTVQLAKILNAENDPRLSNIKCLTMDPGTVNTKMLLAGWGACGIPVERANNTYKLAATKYGAQQESGSYHFGGGGASDSRDPNKLRSLWEALEQHTKCSYSDISSVVD